MKPEDRAVARAGARREESTTATADTDTAITTNQTMTANPVTTPVAVASVPIGDGWSAALQALPGGVLLRVGRGADERTMEIVISLGEDGPVLRARAAALEIETDGDLTARCERFRVEARQSVELISGGTLAAQGHRVEIEATHGTARVRANDDVQLLGENVLLNCDPAPPPIPSWALPTPIVPAPTVAVEEASGDAALVEALTIKGGIANER
jgi:hypothetical protein